MQAEGFSRFGRTNEIVEKVDYNQSKLDFGVGNQLWTGCSRNPTFRKQVSNESGETPLSQKWYSWCLWFRGKRYFQKSSA